MAEVPKAPEAPAAPAVPAVPSIPTAVPLYDLMEALDAEYFHQPWGDIRMSGTYQGFYVVQCSQSSLEELARQLRFHFGLNVQEDDILRTLRATVASGDLVLTPSNQTLSVNRKLFDVLNGPRPRERRLRLAQSRKRKPEVPAPAPDPKAEVVVLEPSEPSEPSQKAAPAASASASASETPECPICHEIPYDPHAFDPCGHGICGLCKTAYKKAECPTCRGPMKGLAPNRWLREMLEPMEAYKARALLAKNPQYVLESIKAKRPGLKIFPTTARGETQIEAVIALDKLLDAITMGRHAPPLRSLFPSRPPGTFSVIITNAGGLVGGTFFSLSAQEVVKVMDAGYMLLFAAFPFSASSTAGNI
jgi:hypothetical protein